MIEWKQIQNYPNYEISNEGQVRNVNTGLILKCGSSTGGYLKVFLYDNGNRENVYIHQLVAKHFVEGYEKGLEVDHINKNRMDNRACNLRWITRNENMQNCKTRGQKVRNETLGMDFTSISKAGEWLVENKFFKNKSSAISSLYQHLGNRTMTCAKCEWRFIND